MIIKDELKRVNKLIDGYCIYINPTYVENFQSTIRIVPLLINKSLVYINKDNPNFSLIEPNIIDLAKEGYLIPTAIKETNLSKELNECKTVIKQRLVDDALFSNLYCECIDSDYEDDDLRYLVKKSFDVSNEKEFNTTFSRLSFSLNWDIVLTQIIKTPILIDKRIKDIFNYKLKNIFDCFYTPQSINNLNEIKEFLSKVNPIVPSNLTIDQIKIFREDKACIKFRNWIEKTIYNVYDKEKFDKIKTDDYLIKEFNILSESYKTKNNLISYSLSGLAGGFVGGISTGSIVSAGLTGLVTTPFGYALTKLCKNIWKKIGPNPWVFILQDMK
tara:strand:+ start:1757 stop:2746 length:990 start_codon:yes stop_codon:yes gene_type:complete